MDRRGFIRLVGGSAVFGAAAAATGCSTAIPPDAVAAWRGPGDEPDLRRWVLSWAVLAPHSHNLQSWLVELRGTDEMRLFCDRTRLLPETDPFSRQMMMSQGTFLELLDLAARERGQRAEITLFPDGAFGPNEIDDRPVAHVRLVPDAAVAKDPLFAQIPHRRTNRELYDPARAVPDAAWQAMADAAEPFRVVFGRTTAVQHETLSTHRRIAAEAWRIELTTPATILESYKVLRVGPREIAEHRDGVSLTDPMVVWLDRLGLFDRTEAPAPDSFATRSQIEDFDAKIASTPAFLWMLTDDNERPTQVDAGRAYARVQLAATAHGVAMQPLQQALQEYPEVAGPYREIRRALGVADTQTVQMWARVGFAPPVGPAPRRGLDAHLRG